MCLTRESTHLFMCCALIRTRSLFQVAAHTGHSVVQVDMTQELLRAAEQRIKASLQRVARKQFPENKKV